MRIITPADYNDEENQELETLLTELRIISSSDANPKAIASINRDERKLYERVRKRCFRELFQGNLSAIFEDFKDQAKQDLEEWDNYVHKYAADIPIFAQMGILSEDKENPVLKSKRIFEFIIADLDLHLDAMKIDAELYERAYTFLTSLLENSPCTDNEKINPATVKKEKRTSLSTVHSWGLMNNKSKTDMLTVIPDIIDQEIDGQFKLVWETDQAPAGRPAVPTYISLSYEGTEPSLKKRINAYDFAVYEAVSNLYHYWAKEHPAEPFMVSVSEIWRTMNGKRSNDGKTKPGLPQFNKIYNSMVKMSAIRFTANIKAEIDAGYIKIDDDRISQGLIRDYLLSTKEMTFFTEKGKQISGFKINNEPIYYEYNRLRKGGLLYVPFHLLDVSDCIDDLENVTEFKMYLIRQILLMKNGIRHNSKILQSTIYSDAGVKTPEERIEMRTEQQQRLLQNGQTPKTIITSENSKKTTIRKEKKSDIDKVKGILNSLTKKGWISGYKVLNKSGTIAKPRQEIASYKIDYAETEEYKNNNIEYSE